MQPSSNNERTTINLPPPVPEQAPESKAGGAFVSAPEAVPSRPEGAKRTIQPPALNIPVQSPTLAADAILATQNDVFATTNTVVPNAADDSDLIEKEWVTKAKKIVEKTLEDPYQQSKELTIFKADYMKKRYNKTIKLSE